MCTLQRFWSLMQQRERERTAQCFGVTATDFPERAQKLGVDAFVSAADSGLLADFTTLLNLTQAKGAERDEVRKLVCDELMLSGVLHVLTHVQPALLHDVARAHGIAFAATDSDATVADWVMCVAFKLDPIPGGRLPDLVKTGAGEQQDDSAPAAATTKRAHTRTGRGARGAAAKEEKDEEKDNEEENEDENVKENENEPAEKRQKTAAGGAARKSSTTQQQQQHKEEEAKEEKKDKDDDEEEGKPAEQGYYTEDGKWVHPPFELIMAHRFDAQGLYNNFNLPDLVEFCRLHGLPLSSAKKKNALIRVILQYVETGVVPAAGKRKSGGARRASSASSASGDTGRKAEGAAEDENAEHGAASPSPSPSPSPSS